jgi:hypothetical protein
MTQLLLNVNDADLAVLEPLLHRLHITYIRKEEETQTVSLENKTALLAELKELASKITISSFGNPIEWQKETRMDRTLPFRY